MKVGYQTFSLGKKYAFVREGDTRFFMRNIAFLRHDINPNAIVVVREWDAKSEVGAWEPPKGQMEWKDFSEAGVKPEQSLSVTKLMELMKDGVLREIAEEAKIMPTEIKDLHYIPVSYKQAFPKAGNDAFFRYQFWEGTVSDLHSAQSRVRQLVKNPDWVAMLPADVSEKDNVAWWSPNQIKTRNWIRGEFSCSMVKYYVHHFMASKMKG